MPDRISQYRQLRLTLTLPARLPGFPLDELGRATALASIVSTRRGVPDMRPLGSSAMYVPLRDLTEPELLELLWEAAKLVQEP